MKNCFKNNLIKTFKTACMYVGTALILAGCVDLYPSPPAPPNTNLGDSKNILTVSFLDVGQADCMLISLPGGKYAMIDGGNVADGPLIADYLKKRGITTLEVVIATHPHEDHIGGLDDVLNATDVKLIYMPEISEDDTPTTKTYEYFLDAVISEGCDVLPAKAGETIIDGEGWELTCLAPSRTDIGNLNNYSVVAKLSYGDSDFLFTGDAEKEIEEEIMDSGFNFSAEVLKIGHHGSRGSSSKGFIQTINSSYAVISCGKGNNYGHPHKEITERLQNQGIATYRTDLLGTIHIATDGKNFDITNDTNLSLDGNKK